MEVRNPDLEVWTRTKEPPLGTKGPCLRVPRPRPRLVRRLCARASCFSMPGGEGEIEALAAIAGLMLAALAVTRNGVRLPDILTTAMSSSLAADGCRLGATCRQLHPNPAPHGQVFVQLALRWDDTGPAALIHFFPRKALQLKYFRPKVFFIDLHKCL